MWHFAVERELRGNSVHSMFSKLVACWNDDRVMLISIVTACVFVSSSTYFELTFFHWIWCYSKLKAFAAGFMKLQLILQDNNSKLQTKYRRQWPPPYFSSMYV
jgi:hypothetical protein